MTADQFTHLWNSRYPGTIPIPHFFKHDYADRWFRIHSLPQSKRYAEDEGEWEILLGRHNTIITDIFGDNSKVMLVTGEFFADGTVEMHPREETNSFSEIEFVPLDIIDLYKMRPDHYEPGQTYKPMLSEQIWQRNKFDNLLKEIANDKLEAFFIAVDNECIVAPYDGGIDFILKNEHTKSIYKTKYRKWLSSREDGL